LLQTENGNAKLPFVFCKQEWKTAVCFPWSVNDNSNQQLLFQQTCPSIAECQNNVCTGIIPLVNKVSEKRQKFLIGFFAHKEVFFVYF
jgi:hypothetical protein